MRRRGFQQVYRGGSPRSSALDLSRSHPLHVPSAEEATAPDHSALWSTAVRLAVEVDVLRRRLRFAEHDHGLAGSPETFVRLAEARADLEWARRGCVGAALMAEERRASP